MKLTSSTVLAATATLLSFAERSAAQNEAMSSSSSSNPGVASASASPMSAVGSTTATGSSSSSSSMMAASSTGSSDSMSMSASGVDSTVAGTVTDTATIASSILSAVPSTGSGSISSAYYTASSIASEPPITTTFIPSATYQTYPSQTYTYGYAGNGARGQANATTSSMSSAAASSSSMMSMNATMSMSTMSMNATMPVSSAAVSSSSSSSSSMMASSTASAPAPLITTNNVTAIPGAENSPPVYPSPETRGTGNWSVAVSKAKAYIQNLTLPQLVAFATGVGWESGRCVGNTPPIPEIGWKGLCLEDSPAGVRDTDGNSVFPAGITIASTFDKGLMYERGYAMGEEFRGKGVNLALGPGMNMIRAPESGRMWEMGGGDPYLAGELAYYTIRGLQDAGVQATAKHYINNEQERNRTTSSSNVDDRTEHEIYLHPFLKSVQADVASVMCSYNLINSSWACQNSKTLNGYLKGELGFQGFVMSDWAATESGVGAALAGLDMTMPGDIQFSDGLSYFGQNLTDAVTNGSVPLSRVEDMATRILAGYFLVGQDQDFPDVNFNAFNVSGPENLHVNVQGNHAEVIRKIGAEATVLLKNHNNTLPLHKPRSIQLVGSDAGPNPQGPNGCPDRGCDQGTLAIGWGSGTANFPYLIDPVMAIQSRAIQDRTQVGWWLDDFDYSGAIASVANAEVAMVFINSDSGEGYITVDGNEGDRNNLTAWHEGDTLVQHIADNHPNVVVVVHSVGPMTIESWIEHPNVTAVLWANLPGQESGNSLVDILWGEYSPSGRLPYTMAKNRSDYPADIVYVNNDLQPITQVDYLEGLHVDYRHFQAANIEPRFGFGYGLSYSTFSYSNLQISEIQGWNSGFGDEGGIYNIDNSTANLGSTLYQRLQSPRFSVSFDVENTGERNACDIPQMYLGYPNEAQEPPRVLRGFERINLDQGATQTVTFQLSTYDVSIWNTTAQAWTVPYGDFQVYIARDAFDENPVEGTLSVDQIWN